MAEHEQSGNTTSSSDNDTVANTNQLIPCRRLFIDCDSVSFEDYDTLGARLLLLDDESTTDYDTDNGSTHSHTTDLSQGRGLYLSIVDCRAA